MTNTLIAVGSEYPANETLLLMKCTEHEFTGPNTHVLPNNHRLYECKHCGVLVCLDCTGYEIPVECDRKHLDED